MACIASSLHSSEGRQRARTIAEQARERQPGSEGSAFVFGKLPHIAVPSDVLFTIGGYPVYNTFLITILSALVIIGMFYIALRKSRIIPHRAQNLVEWIFTSILNLCYEVAGKKNGRRFFPWVLTIFLLVLISNWWEVIPGIETIGTKSAEVPGCPEQLSGILLWGNSANCIVPWLRPPRLT